MRFGYEEIMASEQSGRIVAPDVLQPPQLSHAEMSAKGGRARSPAKIAASLRNLEKAKAIRDALGARPWHKKKPSD
jgi:hypothetical protein